MSEVASAYVSLLPSAAGWGRKLTSQVGGETDKAGKTIGSRLSNAMKLGLFAGGAALAAFGKSAITAGSEAQQSIGATETVFGKFAQSVIKSSNGAAQAYGLSANEYRENANLLGSLFKNQGISMDKLGGSTDKMIGRAADLAATFGGPTSDAVAALGSAFKGEFDSLERFGISLKESTVSSLLAKRGQDELTGSALAAAKQQAVTDLIFKQSKDSMGAFGKESNTLAGQQQRLGAQFTNIKATLGTALLPVLTQFAGFINSTALPAVTAFIAGMQSGTGVGGQVTAVMTTLGSALSGVAGFLKSNADVILPFVAGLTAGIVVFKTIALVTKVWAAAQALLNVALTANPIGIVIVAVAALVAGLVVAYKRSETFRNIVNGAFAAIKAVAAPVLAWLSTAVRTTIEFVRNHWKTLVVIVGGPLAAIALLVHKHWDTIKSTVSGAVSAVVGFVRDMGRAIVDRVQDVAKFVSGVKDKFGEAVAFVKTIPGKITAAIGNLGSLLYNAGISVLAGFIEGVRSKIDDLQGLLNSVTSKIPDWKGPAGKDEALLRPAGQLIMKGLVDGIEDGMEPLRKKLQEATERIKSELSTVKGLFDSLASSVTSAFSGNLFEATNTADFLTNLSNTSTQLQQFKKAFRKLVKWGLKPAFLSALMQSGNGALLLDMAAGSMSDAQDAAHMYGYTNSLADSLGGAVAQNQYGKKLDGLRDELRGLRKDVQKLGKEFGQEINGVAGKAARSR